MTTAAAATSPIDSSHRPGADRVGVIASVLCAIHCAVTPILLLLAPTFGEIWAHPASHWLVAIFVVPLALVMVLRGFRIHRKRWIITTGFIGMGLIIIGAIIPYWPADDESAVTEVDEPFVYIVGEEMPETEGDDEVFVWIAGEDVPAGNSEGCLDSCCPSLVTDSEGNTTLHIPPASIVTTLGGVALICTRLGNLCACRRRKTGDCCESNFC